MDIEPGQPAPLASKPTVLVAGKRIDPQKMAAIGATAIVVLVL